MVTSLLADKWVIAKNELIMNFMNEHLNPPCNSLLATFFESICGVCLKTVSSSLRRLTRPKRTINQLFKLLFPLPFLLLSPKKMLLEREARRVRWEVHRAKLKWAVCARHALLRPFQGSRRSAHDQRLSLETPGWRVLDFQGNPLSEDELERQREKIRKGPLVVRDRENPFAEDLTTNEAGVVDPQLPVLAKVSCLVDALEMGGSYGLVEKLWAQFLLTAGPVNTEVDWTRDEVLLGAVVFRNRFVSFLIHIVVLLLVYHHYWNTYPNSVANGWLGKGLPFLQP